MAPIPPPRVSGFTTHDSRAALLGGVRPARRDAASRVARRPRRAPRLSPAAIARARRRLSADLLRPAGRRPLQDRGPERDHLADARRRISTRSFRSCRSIRRRSSATRGVGCSPCSSRSSRRRGEPRAASRGSCSSTRLRSTGSTAASSRPSSRAVRTARPWRSFARIWRRAGCANQIPTRFASGRSS